MEKVVYKDGVHNISNSEYHASAGISRSMLMDFKRSPYHYWYKHLSGLAKKEDATPAMNLGNAVHTLVLEESKFEEEFHIIHQQKRPSKNTPPHDKMMAEAQGRIILTKDEYLQAALMAKSVLNDENASQLLQDCIIEQSIYFTHKSTGLQVKARPDAWSGQIIMDLKTTADARLKSFQSSCMTYGYFIQAAIVDAAISSIGEKMEHFVFIPVEKEPPYCVGVYMTDSDSLDYGAKQFDGLMENLAKCLESNTWPGYGVQDLSAPAYAQYDEILEIE